MPAPLLAASLSVKPALRLDPSPFLIERLHAEGPATDRADKMALYGWLIGRWDMDSVVHAEDGTSEPGPHGEIHFGWVLEGRAIQDVWVLPGLFYGTTLRVYDPALDAWHILWSDPLKQYYTRQIGRAHGNDIVQEGTDEAGTPVRWSFTEITPNSFHWVDDMRRAPQPVVLGSVGGVSTNVIFALTAPELFGVNTRLVKGYAGSAGVMLAVQRKEVDGTFIGLSSLAGSQADMLRSGELVPILQFARRTRHPEFPDVPLGQEMVSKPEDKALLTFIESLFFVALPFSGPPGIPADRTKALRDAFMRAHTRSRVQGRGGTAEGRSQSSRRRAGHADHRRHEGDAAHRHREIQAHPRSRRGCEVTPHRITG
jgi:hypothetical protein